MFSDKFFELVYLILHGVLGCCELVYFALHGADNLVFGCQFCSELVSNCVNVACDGHVVFCCECCFCNCFDSFFKAMMFLVSDSWTVGI